MIRVNWSNATALPAPEMSKYSSILESKGSIIEKDKKGENVTIKYCHYPNYLWSKIDTDLVALQGLEERVATEKAGKFKSSKTCSMQKFWSKLNKTRLVSRHSWHKKTNSFNYKAIKSTS
jgi:hypothetical protein